MSQEYQEIRAEEARAYMTRGREKNYLLVDVRQPDEYAREHIPGAVLIPLGELPARQNELPPDRDILFYCRSGMRSRSAAIFTGSRPRTAGTIYNLTGGMLAWNGQVLENLPNLKTFDLDASEQDLLLRAMDLERGAERFYSALRERYNAVPWTAELAILAGAEEMHARMIYSSGPRVKRPRCPSRPSTPAWRANWWKGGARWPNCWPWSSISRSPPAGPCSRSPWASKTRPTTFPG